MEDTLTIGERVLFWRRRRKLEQKELAVAVGVSAPLVGKWERNESQPTLNAKIRLARALGAPLDDFCSPQDLDDLRLALEVGIRDDTTIDLGTDQSFCIGSSGPDDPVEALSRRSRELIPA
jgi:transcriptional regulator with XRE-family HTH domain